MKGEVSTLQAQLKVWTATPEVLNTAPVDFLRRTSDRMQANANVSLCWHSWRSSTAVCVSVFAQLAPTLRRMRACTDTVLTVLLLTVFAACHVCCRLRGRQRPGARLWRRRSRRLRRRSTTTVAAA